MNLYRTNHKEFIKYNKLILKSKQLLITKNNSVFKEEVGKTALSANDDEKRQSINSMETWVYRKRNDLVCKKEENRWNNIRKS